jgi:hypothetical protein
MLESDTAPLDDADEYATYVVVPEVGGSSAVALFSDGSWARWTPVDRPRPAVAVCPLNGPVLVLGGLLDESCICVRCCH